MKQSLELAALVVRDYDEALAFYVGVLGFELVEDRYVPEQDKRWVVVKPPGATESALLLARAANDVQASRIGDQTGGRVFLFLATDDFARDYDRYRARGVRFVRDPKVEPYGTVAVFRDPYGNLWDLVEHHRPEPRRLPASPAFAEPPGEHEAAPFYRAYLAALPARDALELLRRQGRTFAALAAAVPADREGSAYAAAKWSVRGVVAHLAHVERVLGYRALRISHGDPTPLPGFDENAYVASEAERPLADLAGELTHLRAANLALFAGLTDAQARLLGRANDHPVSVRALALILAGHAAHHLAILRDRYGIALEPWPTAGNG